MRQVIPFLRSNIKELSLLMAGVAILALVPTSKFAPKDVNAAYLVPPQDLVHFTLGYNEILADTLWLRWVQDIDYCERPDLTEAQKQAKLQAYAQPFAGEAKTEVVSRCEKGWGYHMLDTITELAPKFRIPYSGGGIALSVLADDREGATKILEKGVRRFPDDWIIAYRAAYHFMYEERDLNRASALLIHAGKNGAPYWVYSLAAKLASKEGQYQFAKAVLLEALEANPNEAAQEVLKKRLEDLEASYRSNP